MLPKSDLRLRLDTTVYDAGSPTGEPKHCDRVTAIVNYRDQPPPPLPHPLLVYLVCRNPTHVCILQEVEDNEAFGNPEVRNNKASSTAKLHIASAHYKDLTIRNQYNTYIAHKHTPTTPYEIDYIVNYVFFENSMRCVLPN